MLRRNCRVAQALARLLGTDALPAGDLTTVVLDEADALVEPHNLSDTLRVLEVRCVQVVLLREAARGVTRACACFAA